MPLLVDPALPAGSLAGLVQPTLAGAQVQLRPWLGEDVAAVRAAFDCPDIKRWHVRRMASDREASDWIAGWSSRWTAETDASWAVVAQHDGRVLGQVGLRTLSLVEATAQLSYWVLPAARGAGVASRAVRALSCWVFDTLRLNRLGLLHSTANEASCRVAGRTGFPLEGTLRGYARHADGWHDMHVHARLRSDPGNAESGPPAASECGTGGR